MPPPLPPARLTHLAFEVDDVAASVRFYTRYTALRVIHERREPDSGTRVAWLQESDRPSGLVLVLVEHPQRSQRRNPFAHLGLAVESAQEVDAVAEAARRDGILAFGPQDCGPIVGYIAMVADPDGNMVEFSFGQEL